MSKEPIINFIVETTLLIRGGFRSVGRAVQRYLVYPISTTFREEEKLLIEKDNKRVKLLELQQELDLAELKADSLRQQIQDGSKKSLSKKALRFSRKAKRKNTKKNSKSDSRTADSQDVRSDQSKKESAELEASLEVQLQKIAELRINIVELSTNDDIESDHEIHQELENAKASLNQFEVVLNKTGYDKQLAIIESIGQRVQQKYLSQQETYTGLFRMTEPAATIKADPETFRELVERHKEKIVQKRATLPTQAELQNIEDFVIKIRRSLDLNRKINDFVGRVDPSSERAFQRLTTHFRSAMEAQEISKAYESKLQLDLLNMLGQVAELSTKISEASPQGAVNLSSKQSTLEASIIDIEATLRAQKRKNRANDTRLFELASLIERVYLIKSMLSILPASLRDEVESLTKVVSAICVYLAGETYSQGTIVFFEERIARLEKNTIMTFIKIAKGETRVLKGRELSRFTQRLESASSELKIERDELRGHQDRYELKLKEADDTQPELLVSVQYKRDHYAGMLKTVEQNLEVLSILSQKQVG